jgi:hypothetical protein
MKNPIRIVSIAAVLLLSTVLNMLVLERAGSVANYVFLYGISGRFVLSGVLTLLAGCTCTVTLLWAFAMYRLSRPTDSVLRQMAIVSIYLSAISLLVILIVAAFPSVHFR